MGNEKSKATGYSAATAKAEQGSVHSKGAVPGERFNVPMVQNVLLIWLDKNTNENSAYIRNIVTQLRRVVNTINTFVDIEECIPFLESMDNEKVCMVISGSLGEHFVPRVHAMPQVDSIFIFCSNKIYHEQWAKEWPKIKGVFTDIAPICEGLKQAAQECEQNAISISFMATDGDDSQKNLDQLDPSFMYTEILKEILLEIEFKGQHIKEYIDYCRDVFAENEDELKNVKKFERKYRDEKPIWWYTFECFLYPMLNRALRLMDLDVMIKMGFFIGDLHRHIEQLHSEQFGGQKPHKSFKVYRGQGMTKEDFEKMTKTKGGLLSFNGFLSTSKNPNVSLNFVHRAVTSPDLVGVLFVMMIDPAKSTTPFASIGDVGYDKDKQEEILFAMRAVFRIGNIIPMDGNHRHFQVELTLTSDNDSDLRVLTDRIREETFPHAKGWYRLGLVLFQIGQSEKVKQVYEILLEQTTKESETAPIYQLIGSAKDDRGEYKEAIAFYEKALEIYKKTLPPTHPVLAVSYSNIGNVYNKMDEYPKALSSYEKDLQIKQKSLPPNHPDLTISYDNIGGIYYTIGEYSKALSSYEKVLEMKQQSLPSNHPSLGSSYNNIGRVYENMRNYSKACSFYERAVKIGQHSLPSNHPYLQIYRNNLDRVEKKL
jgi:tetratricopeptide (TPR) repeat protein